MGEKLLASERSEPVGDGRGGGKNSGSKACNDEERNNIDIVTRTHKCRLSRQKERRRNSSSLVIDCHQGEPAFFYLSFHAHRMGKLATAVKFIRRSAVIVVRRPC
jgi:hypothetical protein